MSQSILKRELAASFRNAGFVVVLAVFAVAAISLEATTQAMGLHFKKEAVPLRQQLETIPRQLGPWLQLNKDARLNEEMEHALGTKEYIGSRQYVDTRQIPDFDRATWDALTDEGRARAIGALIERSPQSIVYLHIAYYTGLVDTVAHVPERCYVAGGFDPVNPQVVTFAAFRNTPGRDPNLQAKFTSYVDRANPGRARNVAYFFQVNGEYEFDSIGGVRARLQNIREKYGYYAKIELMTVLGDKTDLSQAAMADFLSFAMPSIEKCLPDWEAVNRSPAVADEAK